jgi:hypothetical protein
VNKADVPPHKPPEVSKSLLRQQGATKAPPPFFSP